MISDWNKVNYKKAFLFVWKVNGSDLQHGLSVTSHLSPQEDEKDAEKKRCSHDSHDEQTMVVVWWSHYTSFHVQGYTNTVCYLWIHVQYKCSLRKICMVISLLRCFESSGCKSIVSICDIHALLLVKQQDTCQSRQIEAELLLPRRVWKVQLSSQSTCRSC